MARRTHNSFEKISAIRGGGNYWVAICLQNNEWEAAIREQLQRRDFSN